MQTLLSVYIRVCNQNEGVAFSPWVSCRNECIVNTPTNYFLLVLVKQWRCCTPLRILPLLIEVCN
jgi:hypothetical protein